MVTEHVYKIPMFGRIGTGSWVEGGYIHTVPSYYLPREAISLHLASLIQEHATTPVGIAITNG